MLSRVLSRRVLSWLTGLTLLFILSGATGFAGNSIHGSGPVQASANASKTLAAMTTQQPHLLPGKGRALINSTINIHTFLTFDYKIADPGTVANQYDFVWGADPQNVAAYRTANPNIFLTYYMPFHRDYGTFADNGTYTSLQHWQKDHPDWVLYKCDRVTPAYEYGDPNIPLNFTLPSVLTWQVNRYAIPASQNGYDGIAADNVDLGNWYGACGTYQHGQWVQRYSGQPDDPRWRADVLNWLARMQTALHNLPHPLALIPNAAFGGLMPMDPQVQQLVRNSDGIVDEGGFTNFARGYVTDNTWVQTIQLMELAQSQHKGYYSINQFPVVNKSAIQWALSSYLMGKENSAGVYVTDNQGYGSALWYSEFNAAIGSPAGAMYSSQNVYWRSYSHGLSLVNPSATKSYTVQLNGSYKDLYGNSVNGTITLPPHSGIVLLQA